MSRFGRASRFLIQGVGVRSLPLSSVFSACTPLDGDPIFNLFALFTAFVFFALSVLFAFGVPFLIFDSLFPSPACSHSHRRSSVRPQSPDRSELFARFDRSTRRSLGPTAVHGPIRFFTFFVLFAFFAFFDLFFLFASNTIFLFKTRLSSTSSKRFFDFAFFIHFTIFSIFAASALFSI